jgi:hypothetical protein
MSMTEVPLASITTPDTVQTGAGQQQGVALNHYQDFGGARLLFSDIRVAFLLLNEARNRILVRLFGVSTDTSFLVTIIAVGTLAETIHSKAVRVLGVQARPSLGDTMIGAAVLKESIHGIAGARSRDTPFLATLIAFAVLGRSFRPALGASFRGVKASSHRARAGFDHRYGHLVRPGRRR